MEDTYPPEHDPEQHIVTLRDGVDGKLCVEWFTGTAGASFFSLTDGQPESSETIFALDEIELPQAVRALRAALDAESGTALLRDMGGFERLQFEADPGYVTFQKIVLGEPEEMIVFSEEEAKTLLEALKEAIDGLEHVEDEPYV